MATEIEKQQLKRQLESVILEGQIKELLENSYKYGTGYTTCYTINTVISFKLGISGGIPFKQAVNKVLKNSGFIKVRHKSQFAYKFLVPIEAEPEFEMSVIATKKHQILIEKGEINAPSF